MFTVNAEQKNYMCKRMCLMMDMYMCMSMFCCVPMNRDLPKAAAAQYRRR